MSSSAIEDILDTLACSRNLLIKNSDGPRIISNSRMLALRRAAVNGFCILLPELICEVLFNSVFATAIKNLIEGIYLVWYKQTTHLEVNDHPKRLEENKPFASRQRNILFKRLRTEKSLMRYHPFNVNPSEPHGTA